MSQTKRVFLKIRILEIVKGLSIVEILLMIYQLVFITGVGTTKMARMNVMKLFRSSAKINTF